MNIRKNFSRVYFIVIATVIVTTTKGQSQFTYNSNSFSITTPEIDSQIIQSRTPYSKVLLETGTGAFFIFQTSGRLQEVFTQFWYYKSGISTQPVVQMSTFYDTIRAPRRNNSFIFNPTPSLGANPTQNLLTTGQFIKLTNCISDTIIPNDTMTLALTYKNYISQIDECTYDQSVIALFYNSSDNTNLFAQVPTDNTTYNFNGTAVKPLRKHNGEAVESLGNLPSAIQSILNSNGSGFSKALYVTVPYATDNLEKNIFLSLAPDPTPANYQSQTGSVKAVIVDFRSENPGSCASATSFLQNFEISFASRDPNSVTITPDFFPNLSSAANKPIDYKIHFENEGPGRANRILVTASIPKGIRFPINGEEMFNCRIGEDDVAVLREGSQVFSTEKKSRFCTYRLDPSNRKIYFTITNARLSGTVGLKGRNNIGEISFRLKTNGRRSIPKSMYSNISIVFDDNKAEISSGLITVN